MKNEDVKITEISNTDIEASDAFDVEVLELSADDDAGAGTVFYRSTTTCSCTC